MEYNKLKYDMLAGTCNRMEAKIDDLKAKLTQLNRYVSHYDICECIANPFILKCTCGLDELRAKI